jgi:hypothetical protein
MHGTFTAEPLRRQRLRVRYEPVGSHMPKVVRIWLRAAPHDWLLGWARAADDGRWIARRRGDPIEKCQPFLRRRDCAYWLAITQAFGAPSG